MHRRAAVLVVAVALAMGGCTGSTTPGATEDGDQALFEAEVQPMLQRRCGFLSCHGRDGMPLTIYAVDYARLSDPQGDIDFTLPPLDERALSPAELEHNRRAVAQRAGSEDPGGKRLLSRLTDGISHANIVVFERADHPDLEVLRRFLETVRAD